MGKAEIVANSERLNPSRAISCRRNLKLTGWLAKPTVERCFGLCGRNVSGTQSLDDFESLMKTALTPFQGRQGRLLCF